MLKYIHGEIYRLLHKKSMYIYFSVLALGYFFLTLVRSSGLSTGAIVNDALNLFMILSVLTGGFLFSAVYTDDLNAKNLIMLVGFGMSKVKIVLSKFILMTLSSAVVWVLIPLYICFVHAVMGRPASAEIITTLYTSAMPHFLKIVAFAAVSGFVVYGSQRPTFSMVAFLLLILGVVSNLLTTAANLEFVNSIAPNFIDHLMSGIAPRILAGVMVGGSSWLLPLLEYVIYTAAALVLSMLAFLKKEMEF
ncbi:MAG: hypothetical protein LBH86_01230 [Oscillospiraceae bacterium]|jgi:ABC-type transport system involved in multi-copper enzyme maturation permease subunit|nr:hypothetical protein [Oscillospiraceae bacterium]